MAAVLVLTDVPALPESVEQWVAKTYSGTVQIVTSVQEAGGKLEGVTSSVDAVVSLMQTPGRHSPDFLSEVARVLKPGGDLLVQEPLLVDVQELKCSSAQTKSALERSLLLAGFVNCQVVESVDGVDIAKACTTSSVALNLVAVRVKKPSWDSASVFEIKKKLVITQNAKDVTYDEDELIDEDALLTEEDLKAPELPVAENCAPTKKACKNCSCGRVELEEKEQEIKLTAAQISNPKSACGSCGLGDAFRCAGCPYRGMPTFKLGEKITLGSALLVADA